MSVAGVIRFVIYAGVAVFAWGWAFGQTIACTNENSCNVTACAPCEGITPALYTAMGALLVGVVAATMLATRSDGRRDWLVDGFSGLVVIVCLVTMTQW